MTKVLRTSLFEATSRFAQALDHAIYDRECEGSQSLVFVYDADLVIHSMLGLTHWEADDPNPEPDLSDPLFVVRALFSVGYLPRAHLLSPHLVEVGRFVKNTHRPDERESGVRERQLSFLIRQWGLNQHDRRVHEYAADPKALEAVIRGEGFEIFVKMELCYGGLVFDRMGRILKNCALYSDALPLYTPLPGDAFAQHVAGLVGQSKVRRRKGLNNLADGYALSELSRHVEAGARVRFYSETAPVRELSGNLRFVEQSSPRSVLREPEYYLMRCSFPALAFSHLGEARADNSTYDDWTLEELQSLNQQLQKLLSADSAPVTEEVLRVQLSSEHTGRSGESLADLIQDFYSLKFLKNVFLRWEAPEAMLDFLPSLANFFNNVPWKSRMRTALELRLVDVAESLGREIEQLERWQADVRDLRGVIQSRSNDFGRKAPDAWMDLGLGRWGLDVVLTPEVRVALTDWLKDIADERKRTEHLASDLALRMSGDSYRDTSEFILTLCQLWCLKLYGRLVQEWEKHGIDLAPARETHVLQILYLVASIKLIVAGVQNDPEVERARVLAVVEEAEQRMSTPPELEGDDIRGIELMGLAHVTYWGWKRLRNFDGETALRMAEKSFAAANEAKNLFPPSGLAWSFAVNHCVYVCTVADLSPPELDQMWRQMSDINTQYHGHYRFADTHARQLTEEVMKVVEQHGLNAIIHEPPLTEIKDSLCSNVKEAKRLLDRARPFFGDEEVEDHWRQLNRYEVSLLCHRRGVVVPSVG